MTTKRKFHNDTTLTQLPVPKSAKIHKAHPSGLYIKCYPTGSRTFGYIALNAQGNPQFKPFGKHAPRIDHGPDELTFDEALQKLARHVDTFLQQKKDGPPKRATLDPDTTFFELLGLLMRTDINTREISQETKERWEYILKNHWLMRDIPEGTGVWGDMRVRDFNSTEVVDHYMTTLRVMQAERNALENKRAPSTLAFKCNQFAQTLFALAVRRKLMDIAHVPPKKFNGLNKERAITRWLAVSEIEHLFNATTMEAVAEEKARTDADDDADDEEGEGTRMTELRACFLRITFLTGIRINSVRLACRSELHKQVRGFWTIPAENLKEHEGQKSSPTDHVVPVTPLLEKELARLNQSTGKFDWLFPERWPGCKGEVRPRSTGWAGHAVTKCKAQLQNEGPNAWTAQALRRTTSNVMRMLGIPSDVIDKASARVPKGTARTYLTAEISDQVELAFEIYHDFLEACMHGKGNEFMEDVRRERQKAKRLEGTERRKRIGLTAA